MRDLTENVARFCGYVYRGYSDLPKRLQRKHLELTLKHLQELVDRAPLDQDFFQQSMSNLDRCFDGMVLLNERAMSRHTSNFRVKVVHDILDRLDIKLPSSNTEPAFKPLLSTVLNGIYATADAVIDDLADRRNDVAHGSDFEILDFETLLAIADVVYQYDSWILRAAAQDHLEGLVKREGDVIGEIDHVWQDQATRRRTVARLVDVTQVLSSGSGVYIISKHITPCTIVEIQHKGERLPEAVPGKGPYGINLSSDIFKGNELRRIPGKWHRPERALLDSLDTSPTFRFSDLAI
jgi:butyrate kinase